MGRSVRPVSPAARDGPARHGLGVKSIMFPAADSPTPALPAPKKQKLLGEGAYLCTQQPTGTSLLLKAPPTPVPFLLGTVVGVGPKPMERNCRPPSRSSTPTVTRDTRPHSLPGRGAESAPRALVEVDSRPATRRRACV